MAAKKPETKLEEIVKPEYRIPVVNLAFRVDGKSYDFVDIELDDIGVYSTEKTVRIPIKKAWATLRKAVRAYRRSLLYAHIYGHHPDDWRHDEGGTHWFIHREVLQYFADWLVFTAPLETLLRQAEEQAAVRRKKWNESKAQREEQFYENARKYWSDRGYSWQGYSWGMFGGTSNADYGNALKIFGLTSETATPETIKKKYRQLAKQHHPDVGGDPEQFKRVNNAYQVLMKSLEVNA